MLLVRSFLIAGLAASVLGAASLDSKTTIEAIKKGGALSAQASAALEERLVKKPGDAQARVQLLAYYSAPPAGADLPAVKAARAKHILWLLERDPKNGFGLLRLTTGIFRLNCRGDALADPEAFERARPLWAAAVQKNSKDAVLRRVAANAIQYCAPEQAEEMLTEGREASGLGELYASAALGITGESYEGFNPTGADAALRATPFAEKARRILETASDKAMVVSAANVLLQKGAILWADGKLDWDYTPLGNELLAKARRLAPEDYSLSMLPKALPARGNRPTAVFVLGGRTADFPVIRKAPPVYPTSAKAQRIQGTVVTTVVIGLDGRVVHARPVSGPPELLAASVTAIRQWQFQPKTLSGKPCYVVADIETHYNLR